MDLHRASRLGLALLTVAVLGAGCSHIPGLGSKSSATSSASASASPSGTPLAKATGTLDAEVPVPAGFPADVPVYPGARLTAGASFLSTGTASWGMEWETTDPVSKVQAFYQKQFNQGDWTLAAPSSPSPSPTSSTPPAFAMNVARKSNTGYSGRLAINADAGLTMIDLSLVLPRP